jgi:hypothetical protein
MARRNYRVCVGSTQHLVDASEGVPAKDANGCAWVHIQNALLFRTTTIWHRYSTQKSTSIPIITPRSSYQSPRDTTCFFFPTISSCLHPRECCGLALPSGSPSLVCFSRSSLNTKRQKSNPFAHLTSTHRNSANSLTPTSYPMRQFIQLDPKKMLEKTKILTTCAA